MQMEKLLRRPAVLARLGVSKTTLYNLEKSDDFPKHFMLTPGCAVWVQAEIDAWLAARRSAPAPVAKVPLRRAMLPGQGRAAG